jgi:hypothetical protein
MSRIEHYPNVVATEANKNTKFSNVPTKGYWHISYGIDDMTPMQHFIDFEPLDDIAKEQCSVNYNGQEGPEDEPLPKEEWEYNNISLDQMFTKGFGTADWVDILTSFGVDVFGMREKEEWKAELKGMEFYREFKNNLEKGEI